MIERLPNLAGVRDAASAPAEAEAPVNILLVDDQPANLMALEAVLDSPGHNLVRAASGSECLRRLLDDDFAVILMDVKMPDLDGFETASLIRERERSRHIPIIFLTGVERSDIHVFRGYSVGAVDYLVKPVVTEVLRSKVAVFVDLFRKTREVRRQAELLRLAGEREHQRQLAEARQKWEADLLRREREREAELLAREQAARAEAEAANRAKDEFLSMLSHELRTPLNAMLGWLRLQRRGGLDGKQAAEAAESLERNTEAMARLVDDLLDVSRIVLGKLSIERRRLDLGETVAAALEAIRPTAEARNVRIETDLAPALTLQGDRNRLQQVVWNLLTNAIKFSPEGGRVAIRLRRAGARAEIEVEDNGRGISPEFLPRMFERFRQADSKTTRRHDGLGLGLAIVKSVVELHGGSVRAASEGLGKGAVFTVTLPLEVAGTASAAAPPASAPDAEPADARRPAANGAGGGAGREQVLKGVRVLVVEDSPDSRKMLTLFLKLSGAETAEAASVDEALERWRERRPDVLVSDIGLPGEDGFSLIRRIRAMEPAAGGRVPAIALTGFASTDNQRECLEAGFQSYLAKPVEPTNLARSIQGLLAECKPK